MTAYLAIDGGNSKTDVVIGDADGGVLAYARGAGTCHQNIGLTETINRLRSLVERASTAGGVTTFDRADVFLAGADLKAEVDMLTAAVAELGWAPTLRLENDTLALLRAGTDASDAVAVVCGAGINCVGRSASGQTARFGSLGLVSGDWGGGGHLGQLTLWHAVRGEDGRSQATALSTAVAEHFGLRTAEEVGARMHLGELDDGRLGELTMPLLRVADAGDEVARAVVAQQAAEIVTLATVAARRLDLLDLPFAVVLGGGVLRVQHPLLIKPVTEKILAVAPNAMIAVVEAPPVLGAALNALDALGATAEAHERLRASLS